MARIGLWHVSRKCQASAAFAREVSMGLILLVILIILLFGSVPRWPHSRGWGYWPSGTLGLILLIVIILLIAGRI